MQTFIQSYKLLLLSTFSLLVLTLSCGSSATLVDNTEKKPNTILSSSAPFSDATFRIDGDAFVIKNKTDYTLTATAPKPKFEDTFGTFVQFNKDGTFQGYYNAECGNDCFTNVKGTFKMLEEHQMEIFVSLATQSGECPDKTIMKNKKVGTFKITTKDKKNYTLTLI